MTGRHQRPKPLVAETLVLVAGSLLLALWIGQLALYDETPDGFPIITDTVGSLLAASPTSTVAVITELPSPPLTATVDPSTSSSETRDTVPAPTRTNTTGTTAEPTTTEAGLVVAVAAETMLAAETNQLRVSLDLPQLALDVSLRDYARRHAEDMAETGNLAHSDIGDLLGPWLIVGENLGRDGSAVAIFDGLAGSPDHYALLVDSDFTATGVGAVVAEDGTLWVCQIFGGTETQTTTLPVVTIPIPTLPEVTLPEVTVTN